MYHVSLFLLFHQQLVLPFNIYNVIKIIDLIVKNNIVHGATSSYPCL